MTSDAKIGLLLGLTCIFIIAFVINGLPRFRSATSNNELTNSMVNPADESLGIAEKERKVQETFDWQQHFESELAKDFAAVTQGRSEADDVVFNSAEGIDTASAAAFNEENPDSVRFTMPLTTNASVMEEAVIEEPIAEPLVPVVSSERARPVREGSVKPAKPKTYVVQDGDRLSDIAKKFYGQVEGNRLVNINRIFEANRKVLKSVDDIYIGQKLVIPPLPASTQSGDNRNIFSGRLFERVSSIGGGSESARWYVVKDGDSLWDIAAEQLGQGTRYAEISKLNKDILTDEDSIKVGMRLRLPTK
jgi:nucleoid-associated protein YgaU